MKITLYPVTGWEGAIKGMRFPKNSDVLSDSGFNPFFFGNKDYDLACRLVKAGKDHRKFLRMIHVQAAIKMPMGWWAQFDTYKVGTVANSHSRMHRMCERPLTRDDFFGLNLELLGGLLDPINEAIQVYKATQDPMAWRKVIDNLPLSYLQERMVDMNYEVLLNIIPARIHEKLAPEWGLFCATFLACPHLKEFYELIS